MYPGCDVPDGEELNVWGSERVMQGVSGEMIAAAAGLTPSQLAYSFCRSRWYIPSTIIGATTMEQLKENLLTFTPGRELDIDILGAIEDVHKRHRNPTLMD
ncbi:hypothetical protein CYMTET_17713 [Cymbomonas tetramitiformis]|uniref:NADP-dependent oxidoreductase domain-containing protein n=1 Tax=Cymbomonas tetramitiformis TaxID=36881 RepID=A0AAE0GAW9_9CHLO|nr:hypothetical protein CYMTET_17713 [Cymbomonas tetramitiformis]